MDDGYPGLPVKTQALPINQGQFVQYPMQFGQFGQLPPQQFAHLAQLQQQQQPQQLQFAAPGYPATQVFVPMNMGYPHGAIPANVVVPAFVSGVGGMALPMLGPDLEKQVHSDLKSARGVVLKQEAQFMEAMMQSMGVPLEQPNKYKIGFLPPGKQVKKDQEDDQGWAPTKSELDAVATYFKASEESDECSRMMYTMLGVRQLRPMKIHLAVNGTSGDVYLIDRQFQCGGCCCMPLEMTLYAPNSQPPRLVGRVRESFEPYFCKCCACCCLATVYHDIERVDSVTGQMQLQYTLRANTCCCGRVNNCCGATCCKNDMVFDILDSTGNVVAHLQKTFGGGKTCEDCCAATAQVEFDYDNYILEFPTNSSVEDRVLLLTSVFQLDFHLFEKPNNNHHQQHHHHHHQHHLYPF